MDIVDDYEHLEDSLEYVLENVIYQPKQIVSDIYVEEYQRLKELYNSVYSQNCSCIETCSSLESCLHGGSYKQISKNDNSKELILNKSRLCNDLIYECYESCNCPSACLNRLVQYGPRKNLRIVNVYYNSAKQKGLTTMKFIPKGGFICEYAGEILTQSEAYRRHACNKVKKKINYIICLNESSTVLSEDKFQTFIDPSEKGNIGRYLNHSCDPNCEILSVRIGRPLPHLGIFAKKNILPFEELCFHYGDGSRGKQQESVDRVKCFCGSENCEKFLPNFSFQ